MGHLLYIVPLVLLFYFAIVCVCVTVSSPMCGFNVVKKKRSNISVAVVREIPAKGQGSWQAYTASASELWAPIRIFVSTVDLETTSMHCTAQGQSRPNFLSGTWLCQAEDILTSEKKKTLIDYILPGAVKLHQERLLVKPMNVAFKVPEFDKSDLCYEFSVPKEHRDPGFSGYDIVVYVAAGPSQLPVVAWGVLCGLLNNRRPVVGAMYFAPNRIVGNSEMVRVAAHEMAHVLGFDRDIFIKAKIITVKPDTRGKKVAVFLSSAKAVEKAREHYNCSTAPGIELEDDGGEATALSHWERRNAKDELMAGITGIGYYTALTMAAFEGTTYYRANWGMEETMSWGKDAGCGFLMGKCVENNIPKYPEFFCGVLSATPECTSDRRGLGSCVLFAHPHGLPHVYRYFNDHRVGGHYSELMDFCPIVLPWVDGFCNGDNKNGFPGIRTGPLSWCLKGQSLKLNGKIIGDVCAEVQCDNESVQVRYYGDDEWYPCPEGSVLKPKKTFTNGGIVCPKYREVCTIAPDGSSRIVKNNISKINEGNNVDVFRGSNEKGSAMGSVEENLKKNSFDSNVATESPKGVETLMQGERDGEGGESGAPSEISPRGESKKYDTTIGIKRRHFGEVLGDTDVSVVVSLFPSVFILLTVLSAMMDH